MFSSPLSKLPLALALLSIQHAALFSAATYVYVNGSGTESAHNVTNLDDGAAHYDNSSYSNTTYLIIGDSSSYNEINLSNGSDIYCYAGYLGSGDAEWNNSGSGHNSITLSGSGSVMGISQTLFVGKYTTGNSLTVEGGAAVQGGSITLGGSSTGTGNSITVTGSSITSGLQIGMGIAGTFDSSYSGGNVLTVEGGASCTNLVSVGEFHNNDNHCYVIGAGQEDTSTSVSGSSFNVGYCSNKNTLSISNGASGSFDYVYVGTSNGEGDGNGCHNTLTVSGAGSSFAVSSSLMIGLYGAAVDNKLDVNDGARLTAWDVTIGDYNDDNNNTLLVRDAGSMAVLSGTVIVGPAEADAGRTSTGNSIKIENGAIVAVSGTLSVISGNYVDFADGFLALAGNVSESAVNTLLGGKYMVYSSGAYTSSGVLTVTYCSSVADIRTLLGTTYSAAYSDSDLASLVDYTFITGGESTVPEPATCAGLAGIAALGIASLARRRRSA